MARTLTDGSKTLYRYETKEKAELIIERGYIEPTTEDNYEGLVFGNHGIPLRRIDDSVDINGNKCRGSETSCIFLTQSYPFYETNIGYKWAADFVFPIKVSDILDQNFMIYRSPRRGCGNIYVIPDPYYRPLHIDVSMAKKLDWKWNLYAFGVAPFVSPLQMIHRKIKGI